MPVFRNEKNGTWYVMARYVDWQGNHKQKCKRGFETKREALEWERVFHLQQSADMDMTFESFVDIYKSDIRSRIKETTWLTKINIIDKKILPYFGKRKISEIQTKDVIAWQNELMLQKDKNGKPYSECYLKTIHNQLSAIFNHAVKYYELRNNPAAKAGNMGNEHRKEMLFWTKDEYLKFADVMMDKPVSYYAFEMLYWCGLRLGELLALTPSDFDFQNNTVTINKSYQRLHGEDVITTPKTKKSNRTIKMSEFLSEEIQDFIKMQYELEPTDRLFPITKSYLHSEMKRGCKETGLQKIRIHDLRHSHVSLLIELGKGVLDHNNRKFIAENVDRERTKNNVKYKNIPLEEAYHTLFDGALQRYNDRQKRADRKIENYLEHIQKGKQEKPFYEIIVQVGNRDDMGIGTRDEQLAKRILDDYMHHFEVRNPNLFVFNATLHMDEATPHLHIDFIPFTTESKRGLDTRVSMKKALEEQGIYGSGRSDTETMAWLQHEKEMLGYTMQDHGVLWKNQGNNREHLSVLEFKKEQRSKEVAELEAKVSALETEADNLSTMIETVTVLSTDEDFEKEYTLPEPQKLESAKSYKNRIEGLFEKLKAFVKKAFVELLHTRSENRKLNNKIDYLEEKNADLEKSNYRYQQENKRLNKDLTVYRLLKKELGNDEVDRLLNKAKGIRRTERKHNYEQDFFR